MQTFPREMRPIIQFFALFAAICFVVSAPGAQVRIQKAPAGPQTQPPFADDLSKNPDLLKEFGNLINQFQHNIARGKENEWRCRSGSRYLYICEDGLVHWCSQQRGYPGIHLEQYTREHLRREFFTRKPCAPRCTVSCVQQVAILDNWRAPQTLKPMAAPPPAPDQLVQLAGPRARN